MRRGPLLERGLAVLALALAGQAAIAIEFGLVGSSGNLQFPWSDPPVPIADSVFPATNYWWGGEAWMSASLGEDATLRVSYVRDPILRNSAVAAVQFERGIARISVGPRIGFLNSTAIPLSAGISASVRLQWPGVAYVSMRSDGGTAVSVLHMDSDPQAFTELAAGFYVPHAIVSGVISAKRFNELDASGGLVTDSLTRYAMTIDIFKKNVPYTALLSMGYELRSKRYETAAVTDSLGAVVLGIDSTVQLDEAFKLIGGISTGAYVFGLDALKGRGPANSSFLFSANLGLSVETSALDFKPKPKLEAAEAKGVAEAPKVAEPEAKAAEPAPKPEKPSFSRLALDAGAGAFYNSRISIPGNLAFVAAIFNARVGLWGDVGFRLTKDFSLGAEIGLDYITMNSQGIDLNLYDLPLRAFARYQLGKVGLEVFGGAFLNGIAVTSNVFAIAPAFDVDAGARATFGSFFVEASYVFGVQSKAASLAGVMSVAASYPRFGLGYSLKLVK
jgi:hypothetical protein